jgi:hypothetical protein
VLLSRRRLLAATAALALVGCDQGGTIAQFATSGDVARPGGRGLAQPITITYRLRRPADISALLRGLGGEWPLRTGAPREPGQEYQLVFDGTVPSGDDRTVLPDGSYQLQLVAVEADGRRDERTAVLDVQGADAAPLEVDGPRLSLGTITPDGDGVDDEVRIDFHLSKPALVQISAESEKGDRAAILAPTRRGAGDGSVTWDGSAGGRVFGGKRLPDGAYAITLRASDDAGNVRVRRAPLRISNGGIERVEIAEVSIGPPQLKLGEELRLRVKVVNSGATTIRTMGPPPDRPYRTSESFSTIKDPTSGQPYQLASGAWRVGLGWQDAPQELPLRWGLLPDPGGTIPPGGSAVVEAGIVLDPTPELVSGDGKPKPVRFWVGAIREGVGLATGRTGDQVVTISPG